MNLLSARIRKHRAPQRPLPNPHQTPSDSVAKTKLANRIKTALCVNSSRSRILLRISKPSRETSNRSSDFTASWSDLISACANFGSCRDIGADIFKSTGSRISFFTTKVRLNFFFRWFCFSAAALT